MKNLFITAYRFLANSIVIFSRRYVPLIVSSKYNFILGNCSFGSGQLCLGCNIQRKAFCNSLWNIQKFHTYLA